MSNEYIIFDCTNDQWKYKGIMFAEMDNADVTKIMGGMEAPAGFVAGIMAMIWVDELGIWNWKMRIKFPSGNKQVVSNRFDPKKHQNLNETYLLKDMYRMPMIHKSWHPNPCGTADGLIKIMEDTDMIESKRIVGSENANN